MVGNPSFRGFYLSLLRISYWFSGKFSKSAIIKMIEYWGVQFSNILYLYHVELYKRANGVYFKYYMIRMFTLWCTFSHIDRRTAFRATCHFANFSGQILKRCRKFSGHWEIDRILTLNYCNRHSHTVAWKILLNIYPSRPITNEGGAWFWAAFFPEARDWLTEELTVAIFYT